jgi:hypothetical protein
VSPALAAVVRHEEAGSRLLWTLWLVLFGVMEYRALKHRQLAPLTNVARWYSGARCTAWHGVPRRWAFIAFLGWLGWHVIGKKD